MKNAIQKSLITLTFLCLLSFNTSAQDNYIYAVGLRGGPLAGVSYKRFIDVPIAIEGIVGFNFTNGRLISLTGLYEYHLRLSNEANLYGGGGLTMAFNARQFRVNAETLVGIGYTIPWFPLNVSFDYKPAFNIFRTDFIFNEFGVSARLIF